MKYAKKNTLASGCISYTQSPVHTVDKYIAMCRELQKWASKPSALRIWPAP
jgi:oxaloacetate decarboxylase alpha subunit